MGFRRPRGTLAVRASDKPTLFLCINTMNNSQKVDPTSSIYHAESRPPPCVQLFCVVFRTKFLLAPLAEKVTNLESELSSLTNQITRKQEELTNLKIEIVESGGTK